MSNQYVYLKLNQHLDKLENEFNVELLLIRELIKNIKVYNRGNHKGNAKTTSPKRTI